MAEKRITFKGLPPGDPVPVALPQDRPVLPRIFLLSPANASGIRAKMLFNANAQFNLAQRLRNSGATLGEVFSFVSGLYFRGKLTYAEKFKNPPEGVPGVHIITAAAGLLAPDEPMTLARLQSISATDVHPDNSDYRVPLDRDAIRLKTILTAETQIVLLGSIATPKYVLPLLEVFGERLLFPKDFIGRGDMSRGGLLLRCCSSGSTLEYVPVLGAIRRGARPPKLKPPKSKRPKSQPTKSKPR